MIVSSTFVARSGTYKGSNENVDVKTTLLQNRTPGGKVGCCMTGTECTIVGMC